MHFKLENGQGEHRDFIEAASHSGYRMPLSSGLTNRTASANAYQPAWTQRTIKSCPVSRITSLPNLLALHASIKIRSVVHMDRGSETNRQAVSESYTTGGTEGRMPEDTFGVLLVSA